MGSIGTDVAEAGAAVTEKPRSCARMPTQEEGVHQMSGEPSGRAGESEQGPHRRTQVSQRTLLQSKGMRRTWWTWQ